ncbi:uncharacterized protein E5676_scaffold255G008330 [Cucumis melo var. makuwa]|uniref:Uncharacterized protein LOC103484438 n=3 Tax=Cucumis melo TaxID=3656 RepID=A0A1S3AZ11_CUCME|nr:uncharacterized protein LOC103484438 [Cucumis melo]XP_050944526.1 uncharacterized protein LOC103484438 [Cucumis melo]ADN34031.1 hypothetical protein [Cucumis melo subsp. melo]KAA0052609.1 uncharacterized protein E6C27_scaffold120G002170 [Cucumis melo var. makuwa]TYK13218.1 uncharacterized protein E5676_scaffold255G008330 [Cucumis melo var. makuwa]
MEAEKVLNSYDWVWFHRQIFQKEPTFTILSNSEDHPDDEEGLISSSASLSPNSVLSSSNLGSPFSETTNPKTTPFKEASKPERSRRRKLERKSLSELEFEEVKGFKDLGFVFTEEDRNSELASVIPGLNRLGSEEEEKEKEEKRTLDDDDDEESRVSRPYLSEVWEVLAMDRRREEIINPLLKNWKLPSFNSEIDMKQNLRWWAHTVASTVR